MAWSNVAENGNFVITNNFFGVYDGNMSNQQFSNGWYRIADIYNDIPLRYNYYPSDNDWFTIYDNGNGLVLQGSKYQYTSKQFVVNLRLMLNNIQVTSLSRLSNTDYTGSMIYGVAFAIDNDNHIGSVGIVYAETTWDYVSATMCNLSVFGQDLYNSITGAIPPAYTWQSVSSISGKNGILQSLVQIKEEALNDGEPVSEATVLSFDSLGNINIPSVIDEQMPVDPSDVTSVTATYLIPALENGTYEGIKLLVKKGSIPTSEEDADKVVNLDEPTSILRIDSKSVGNLDEDSHYYFVIFIEDDQGNTATSEPQDCMTDVVLLRTILDSENDVIDACLDNIINYKDCGVNWGKFTESSKTIFGNSGNYCTDSGAISQYFKKKNATKVYIDIEATSPQSQSKLRLAVLKEGYPQWVDNFDDEATNYYKVILINQGWKSLERQVIEMPLTSVPSNAKFRLGFFRADVTVKIRKIYFDDDVIVTQE